MFGIEIPMWGWFAWLVQVLLILYVLWLATRFVQAVERIAERMERRMN